MERIKQALEKARNERSDSVAGSTASRDEPRPKKVLLAPVTPFDKKSIRYTQTKVVVVPPDVLRKNRLLGSGLDAATTSAYKMLRTQVLQKLEAKQLNTLAVVSSLNGEGKTLTATNLAMSLAQEARHTVVLVDMDLRNPSIHKMFGYNAPLGISDYLKGDAELNDIMFNPGMDGLVVVPGREAFANSSELLSSQRINQLVQELKSRYPQRLIIFDLPPLLMADDALAFSPLVDASLLVVEAARVSKEQIEQSIDMLRGTEFLGSVLNRSEQAPAAY